MHCTLRFLYCRHSSFVLLGCKAVSLTAQLSSHGVQRYHASLAHDVTKFTVPSIVKDLARRLDLCNGRKMHAWILEMGLQFDAHIASSLINLYAKCGSLSDASYLFDGLPERDVALWNAMLGGYFNQEGFQEDGILLFRRMLLSDVELDARSLTILVGSCSSSSSLNLQCGKESHAYLIRNALDGDTLLTTALIDMYSRWGRVTEAHKMFDSVKDKNVLVCNAIIHGFCNNGLWEKGLELFGILYNEGCEIDSAMFATSLTSCSDGGAVTFGEVLHCCVIKLSFMFDHIVCTSLLMMYARSGLVEEARNVFVCAPVKGIELWNSMLSGLAANHRSEEVLDVYMQMRLMGLRSDYFTISVVLSACGVIGLHFLGRQIHGELVKRPVLANTVIHSSLMAVYCNVGCMEDALNLFDSCDRSDIVVWGTMISGFCHNKMFHQAIEFFYQRRALVPKLDSALLASLISACTGSASRELGCLFHGYSIKSGTSSDVFVGSALVDMYAKCGLPQSAEDAFSSICCKNLVAWNSLVSCYGHNRMINEAIATFLRMLQHGSVPDSVSVATLLASVSSIAALDRGKMIHGYKLRYDIQSDVHVENALLDMYMKCGSLINARRVFDRMILRKRVAWNTMISGYGYHGRCLEAIRMFEEMQMAGVSPDDATFTSLISACSHSGMVAQGMRLIESMSRDYDIAPRAEHYAALVDLLARAGMLEQAFRFVQKMPVEPMESIWLCLLSACRTSQSKSELGDLVADRLLGLQPEESGSHAQLWNYFGETGSTEKAASVRILMKDKRRKKDPGCSWIEVNSMVQVFYSGYSESPVMSHIHEMLRSTMRMIMGRDGETLQHSEFIELS